MPELPEVETVRRDLRRHVVGRRIVAAEVRGARSVRRPPLGPEFEARLAGRTVVEVRRRGKYLLVDLDGGDVLVVHLRMSGQLLLTGADDPLRPHTHVVVDLDDGRQLRFVDPRTFGELFVLSAGAPAPAVGPDALDDLGTPEQLAAVLRDRRTGLKPLLLDQRRLAGVGNIYADEVLFAAGLRHDREAGSLSEDEVRRLHGALRATLRAAVRHRGSSLADEQYRDLFGRIGRFQRHHRVYDREGRPCVGCGGAVVRTKVAGRSTYWCPTCQT